MSDKPAAPSTRAVLAGRREEWTGPVVNPPIWRGSTHLYESEADRIAALAHNEDGHFHYGRRGAPTQWSLAEALTELEPGAEGTMLYPSGTAALAGAMMSVLEPGDVLLVQDNVYEPTRSIASGLLKRWGVTMEVPDVPRLAAIAKDRGAAVLIDNTWATGLGFPALEHGCDITITALTKHAGGHSDVMMGAASAGATYYAKLRHTAQSFGQVVSPDDAALVARGLRTMPLRLRQSTASALKIAHWLKARAEVAHVLCPMVEGSPGHELWARDFSGGCGLFSFVLAGHTSEQRAAFVDTLELFGIGYSWGGFESLALPFDAARIRSASAWPKPGWREEDHLGIRLAIGLEDADDLIADLDRAFATIKHS